MTNFDVLLKEIGNKLLKALDHLEYSYKKIQKIPGDISLMDDEMMETWESFAARFTRVSDIFMMQYVRAKIASEEPGFNGSTRDYLNKAEKLRFIRSAKEWFGIRELRNIAAHEYRDEDLTQLYAKLKALCPTLLAIRHDVLGVSK